MAEMAPPGSPGPHSKQALPSGSWTRAATGPVSPDSCREGHLILVPPPLLRGLTDGHGTLLRSAVALRNPCSWRNLKCLGMGDEAPGESLRPVGLQPQGVLGQAEPWTQQTEQCSGGGGTRRQSWGTWGAVAVLCLTL